MSKDMKRPPYPAAPVRRLPWGLTVLARASIIVDLAMTVLILPFQLLMDYSLSLQGAATSGTSVFQFVWLTASRVCMLILLGRRRADLPAALLLLPRIATAVYGLVGELAKPLAEGWPAVCCDVAVILGLLLTAVICCARLPLSRRLRTALVGGLVGIYTLGWCVAQPGRLLWDFLSLPDVVEDPILLAVLVAVDAAVLLPFCAQYAFAICRDLFTALALARAEPVEQPELPDQGAYVPPFADQGSYTAPERKDPTDQGSYAAPERKDPADQGSYSPPEEPGGLTFHGIMDDGTHELHFTDENGQQCRVYGRWVDVDEDI